MLTFVSMTAGLDLSRFTRHRRWENNAGERCRKLLEKNALG